jgi:putative addiction module CopG family antidote
MTYDWSGEIAMSRTTTLTVRLGEQLSDFVAENVGDTGDFENVSEYVRDLIRRDMERAEGDAFHRLKAELQMAFSLADDSFQPLDAETVIARGRARAAR